MMLFYTTSDGFRLRINEAETDDETSTYAATYPIAMISVVICSRSWFCCCHSSAPVRLPWGTSWEVLRFHNPKSL